MRVERGACVPVTFLLNDATVQAQVPARQKLVEFLRENFGLTGTHIGCESGACGACNVLVDGEVTRACLMLAVQADGAAVVTIEGLHESGAIAPLQAEFVARNALQCGFCTSGMLMTAQHVLKTQPGAGRDEVRAALLGNICRCTGYQAIIDSICAVLAMQRDGDDGR
jgi:carbon-monoxide dehydrogenase small subunit